MLMNFMNTCIKNRKSRGGLFFVFWFVCLFVCFCLPILPFNKLGCGGAGFPPQKIEKF